MSPSASYVGTTAAASTGLSSAAGALGTTVSEAKRELSYLLDSYNTNTDEGGGSNRKVLVLDPGLRNPLELVVGGAFLQQHGVIRTHLLDDDGHNLADDEIGSIVFISRPQVSNMDSVARLVKSVESHRQQRNSLQLSFHLIFIPNHTFLCEKRLETLEVLGSFQETSNGTVDVAATFSWFPLETDVLSLERPDIFREFYLERDPTCLHSVARALVDLQVLYGFAPRVYGKGNMAKRMWDYVRMIRAEMEAEMDRSASSNSSEPPLFDTIVVLDRQVDLVSLLMTQLTYEGLIDEFCGIHQTKVKLPEESSSDSSPKASGTSKVLNSSDDLFVDLRDKHFQSVAPILQKRVKSVSAQEAQVKKAERVSELKHIVEHTLRQHMTNKSHLDKHLKIATMITEQTSRPSFRGFLKTEADLANNYDVHKPVDFIEDAACQDEDMIRVLRLMCLQSQISNGLKPKILEGYKRLCLQGYGHSHLLTLLNLERSGLLTQQPSTGGSSSNYAVLRKRLTLTSDHEDPTNTTDFAYVHNGYAPLSVRLVQQCFKPRGWHACKDVLDMLPGPNFEDEQKLDQSGPTSTSASSSDSNKKCLVVFVGGCTFAEVSALRFLSQQEDSNVEYTVATTSMTNGNTFLTGLSHQLKDPLGLSDFGYTTR